jgi:hypothetical protein
MAVVAFAMLVALGWRRVEAWAGSRVAVLALAGVVVAAEVFPAKTWRHFRSFPSPPAYVEWLGQAPHGVLLELPIGAIAGDGLPLYWSVFHGHRLVNGWGAFPSSLTRTLARAGNRWPFPWASRLFRRYGVDYVVVHTDRWPSARRARLEGAVLPRGVRLEASFGPDRIYSISRVEGGSSPVLDEDDEPVLKRLRRAGGSTSGRVIEMP